MNEPVATTAVAPSRNGKRRAAMFSVLALAIAAIGTGGWTYWKEVGSRYVSTDNAYTAAEVALVTSEIDGLVTEVRVADSQQVKRGDILVVLDDTDVKLAARQAEADLVRARAQIAAAKADLERAGVDLKRREALAGSGSVSGDEVTHVKNVASNARAALDAALAAEAQAQAHVDKTKVDLGRTVIRAPVDGIVARRQVQLGQHVPPSAPLLSVVPVQDMYVNANFKEVQLKDVQPGQKVELTSDLHGEEIVYHGVIDGFSGGTGAAFALIPAQNATGNWIKVVQRLPVRVRLDPAELQTHPLRVGLSMTAKVDVRSKS
jgi:membrane fusion protein (multidrug efflux system)